MCGFELSHRRIINPMFVCNTYVYVCIYIWICMYVYAYTYARWMGQPTQRATNYTARSNIDTALIFLHANGQRPNRAMIRQRSRRRQRRGEPHTEHDIPAHHLFGFVACCCSGHSEHGRRARVKHETEYMYMHVWLYMYICIYVYQVNPIYVYYIYVYVSIRIPAHHQVGLVARRCACHSELGWRAYIKIELNICIYICAYMDIYIYIYVYEIGRASCRERV